MCVSAAGWKRTVMFSLCIYLFRTLVVAGAQLHLCLFIS